MSNAQHRILLTGGTGYVGGRLLKPLAARGYAVRCLARRPETLAPRLPAGAEAVAGDLLDASSLTAVMDGVVTAYYLVHCLAADRHFEQQERMAATNFAAAAKAAGVRRIIYLGALGNPSQTLSAHLRSRQETGDILRASGVETIEFRSSVILGSGSLSFELIRNLCERLPIMICPRWVATPTQPIAIEDVLDYLLQALDLPCEGHRLFEIGGPAQVSYGDIMREYATQRGLRRWMISIPLLTPYLSSLWLGLVTPVYARIGRKLIEGLRNPTIVTDDAVLRALPIRPRGLRQSIARAIACEDHDFAQTRWSDSLSAAGIQPHWGGVRFGSRLVDTRTASVAMPASDVFARIERIGGDTGWYFGDWLWHIRGFLDLLFRGPGLRRGRRDPERLVVGDTLDFWRVEAIEPGRLLRLQAEMKLPGRAWLEFEVTPNPHGCTVRQTAIFDPRGLGGLIYWYALYPIHHLVFDGMLRGIIRAGHRGRQPRILLQE